jgi:glutamine amidotransferase
MLLLINTGTSNLGAWISILDKLNQKFILSDSANWKVENISKIIFPGVGNFEEAIKNISKNKLKEKIIYLIKNKVPYLGICLGMQILFEKSEESENKNCYGLNLIEGEVLKISEKKIFLPHNGWNDIKLLKKSVILKDIKSGENFYFNHSYYCKCKNKSNITSALLDHLKITTSIEKNYVFGVQFHPEKSMTAGLKIIKNFTDIKC